MRRTFLFSALALFTLPGSSFLTVARAESTPPAIQTIELHLGSALPGANPGTAGNSFNLGSDGPSRVAGGEQIEIRFFQGNDKSILTPVPLSEIQLLGASRSDGAVLVRSASATVAKNAPAPATLFRPLYLFGDGNGGSRAVNYGGNVMLGDGDEVTATLGGLAVTSLSFVVEGFRSDDASLVVKLLGSFHGIKMDTFRTELNPPPAPVRERAAPPLRKRRSSNFRGPAPAPAPAGRCIARYNSANDMKCAVSSANSCDFDPDCLWLP